MDYRSVSSRMHCESQRTWSKQRASTFVSLDGVLLWSRNIMGIRVCRASDDDSGILSNDTIGDELRLQCLSASSSKLAGPG